MICPQELFLIVTNQYKLCGAPVWKAAAFNGIAGNSRESPENSVFQSISPEFPFGSSCAPQVMCECLGATAAICCVCCICCIFVPLVLLSHFSWFEGPLETVYFVLEAALFYAGLALFVVMLMITGYYCYWRNYYCSIPAPSFCGWTAPSFCRWTTPSSCRWRQKYSRFVNDIRSCC